MKRIQEFEINDLVKLASEDGDVILEQGDRIATIEFDEKVDARIISDLAEVLLQDLAIPDTIEMEDEYEDSEYGDLDPYSVDPSRYTDSIIKALQELITFLDKYWAGKLTMDELVAVYEDSLYLFAMESMGHGVGHQDETVVTDMLQARGVDVPDLFNVADLDGVLRDAAFDALNDLLEGCKAHGKKKKKGKKKEQERIVIATLKTKGGRYEVRAYKDDKFGNYDIEELTSGSSSGMSHGIKTHDDLIAKLVNTIFFAARIDGINYRDIESSLRGEVALYFNPEAKFSKLMIFSVDDPRVKANRDKVTVVDIQIDYDTIMSVVNDFLQAQGFAEGVLVRETYKKGDKIMVPHKGIIVQGTVVRHDKGGPESPFYVVDIGEYESLKVPTHKVESVGNIKERFVVWRNIEQISGIPENDVVWAAPTLEEAIGHGIAEAQRIIDDGYTPESYWQGDARFTITVEDTQQMGPKYLYWIMRDSEVGPGLKSKIVGYFVDMRGRIEKVGM